MKHHFNKELFSRMVRLYRVGGLRPCARLIGVSATTLFRLEAGDIPRIDVFLKVCEWLKVSPKVFIK